eukprot:520924-Amphidinium_carterae.1
MLGDVWEQHHAVRCEVISGYPVAGGGKADQSSEETGIVRPPALWPDWAHAPQDKDCEYEVYVGDAAPKLVHFSNTQPRKERENMIARHLAMMPEWLEFRWSPTAVHISLADAYPNAKE